MLTQIVIFTLTTIGMYLTQQADKNLQRYACFFGLSVQPFWFYETYTHSQWGMFALNFIMSYIWLLGLYNNWLKEKLYVRFYKN